MDKIDFKELAKDETLINKLKQFDSSIDQIKEFITNFEDPEYYDNLSNSDKIKYNLLMSFCLNSLFWMYLRTEGKNTLFYFHFVYSFFLVLLFFLFFRLN